MFRPVEQFAAGLGPAAGAGDPARAAAPQLWALPSAIAGPLASTPARLAARLRARLHARLAAIDWAPDLAENIGTPRWYRGLATLATLAVAALAFWPDLSALEAAPALRLDAAAGDEFRTQAIAPLGRGGESGRRRGFTYAVRAVPYVPERPVVQLASVLAPGDSLPRLFQRAGVTGGDAAAAAALVGSVVPVDQIAPGTRVALVLGPRPAPGLPRPLEHAELRARFDLALAVTRGGGGLALVRKPIAIDTTPLRIRGTVGDSLYRSARAAGAPPQAIQEYLQALDGHLSLESDIQPGDSFDLVFAVKRAATGETQVGDLLYAGLTRPGGTAAATPVAELLRWGKDGGFYSAEALAAPQRDTVTISSGGGMLMPVNGHVTSGYGQRFHPILGYSRMHAGVDFGAAWGSPIVAAAGGVVSYAGYHGGHGNFVRLEHGGGLGTGYAHMSRIAVSPGERVSAGEIIGYVGSTGLSTGPHLHYEMYQNGRTVNPLGVRFAAVAVTRQVDQKELGAFRARLAQLKALRPGAVLVRASTAVRQLALRQGAGPAAY